jgi:hypothetical protein
LCANEDGRNGEYGLDFHGIPLPCGVFKELGPLIPWVRFKLSFLLSNADVKLQPFWAF